MQYLRVWLFAWMGAYGSVALGFDFRHVNGLEISDPRQRPELNVAIGMAGWTTSVIGPNYLITARHIFGSAPTSSIYNRVFAADGSYYGAITDYRYGSGSFEDVAILKVAPQAAGATLPYLAIHDFPVVAGSTAVIASHGPDVDNGPRFPIPRWGTLEVDDGTGEDGTGIHVRVHTASYQLTDVALKIGDSGSGWYVRDGLDWRLLTISRYRDAAGGGGLAVHLYAAQIHAMMQEMNDGVPVPAPAPAAAPLPHTVWTGATLSWNDPSNWSAGVPKTASDIWIDSDQIAQINGANAAARDVIIGSTGNGVVHQLNSAASFTGAMVIGANSWNAGTYNVSGGTLSVRSAHVGYHGHGALVQSGGTTNVAEYLELGRGAGSAGSFTLSGNAILRAGAIVVGRAGRGHFHQVSGSTIVASDLRIGIGDVGRFIHSSGTVSVNGRMVIGPGGSYAMESGTLTVKSRSQNNGEFTQSSGQAKFGRLDGSGMVTVASGTFGASRLRQQRLLVGETARVDLLVDPHHTVADYDRTSRVGELIFGGEIGSPATLDIGNNRLIIDYEGESPYADLLARVRRASGNGALNWAGSGITSSRADKTTWGLGIVEAGRFGITSFGGQPVDSTSILIGLTYYGDTNLDGRVDIADLGNWASHRHEIGEWGSGDFNYDGQIDVVDLGLLASNWQRIVEVPISTPQQQIPEPSALLVTLSLVALAAMRRRRLASCHASEHRRR